MTVLVDGVEEPVDQYVLSGGIEVALPTVQLYRTTASTYSPGPVMGLTASRLAGISARKSTTPWSTFWSALQNSGGTRAIPTVRPTSVKFGTTGVYPPAPVPVLEDIVRTTNPLSPAKDHESTQLFPWADDGVAAYTQALMYAMTGNSVHKSNVLSILSAWASTLVEVEGKNIASPGVGGLESAKFYCAWAIPQYAKAISIMDSLGEPVPSDFVNMAQSVVYPQLDWVVAANPAASYSEARLALAVVRKNETAVLEAVNYFKYRLRQIISMATDSETDRRTVDYFSPTMPLGTPPRVRIAGHGIDTPDETAVMWHFSNDSSANWIDGIGVESARDMSHMMMGMVGVANAMETALANGIDLYSENQSRMVQAMELHAAWIREGLEYLNTTGQTTTTFDSSQTTASSPWAPVGAYNSSGTLGGGTPWPFQLGKFFWKGTAWRSGWEVAYRHYSMVPTPPSMPNTEALLYGWTNGSFSYPGIRNSAPPYPTLHIAHETFTHGYVR